MQAHAMRAHARTARRRWRDVSGLALRGRHERASAARRTGQNSATQGPGLVSQGCIPLRRSGERKIPGRAWAFV